MAAISAQARVPFFGPRVVRGAFVLALFGWGIGFYGPPVFLHAVESRTGWPLTLVSAAVTLHFVFGALVVTRLPRWHRRHGIGTTAIIGAVVTSIGILGWATASQPWHLFVAALASGGGWVTMGAVTVNAVIARWYDRLRPLALAKAYNGASLGGVVFSPLWVWLISSLGFASAAAAIGAATVAVVAVLARAVFAPTPELLGQSPDGDAPGATAPAAGAGRARSLPATHPWRDRRLLTLALGMAASLFAQIGLVAHLFSLLVPVLGAQYAGFTMGGATACAIAGRWVAARVMSRGIERRLVAATAYALQLIGTLLLLSAGADDTALILAGVALFGSGIGNATSLPPLIAQAEFTPHEVARVVTLIVALSQATYAFAPAALGAILAASGAGAAGIGHGVAGFFIAAAFVQCGAIALLLAGRTARHTRA